MRLFNHPQNATALKIDKVWELNFCSDCEKQKTCDKSYGKIHTISQYVYRYLIDMENGFKLYPHGKSWEYEPEWFINMLTAGQNELRTIQTEQSKAQTIKGKR